MAVFIDENVTEGCCIIVLSLLQLEKIVAFGSTVLVKIVSVLTFVD
jgi:hypothetical protein